MNTLKTKSLSLPVTPNRFTRPANRKELAQWVTHFAGITLPEKPVCEGHDTPLDYLEHAFFESAEPGDTVVWACRGGGKTMMGAVATLLDMLFKPRTQIRILAGSREQSGKMYGYLRSLVESGFEDFLARPISTKGFSFHNGSSVEILSQSANAVRGTRVQKMRCDEVELFRPEIWSAAQLTTRSLELPEPPAAQHSASSTSPSDATRPVSVRGSVEVYSTMHRVGGLMSKLMAEPHTPDAAAAAGRRIFRWCVWDVISRCNPRRKCERCDLWNGCRGRARHANGFLPVADVLAMKRRVSPKVWDSEMLCFAPYNENQVFSEYTIKHHRLTFPFDELPAPGTALRAGEIPLRFESLIAGIDFGWRTFACLWIAMLRNDRGDRVAWVLDEYAKEKRTLEFNINAIRSHHPAGTTTPWQPEALYCDIAGRQYNSHSGESSEEKLRAAGFTVRSRAMSLEDSIGTVNDMLALRDIEIAGTTRKIPSLYLHPRCTQLHNALCQYHRNPNGVPVKDGTTDHLVDALRYALVGHDANTHKIETRHY